jgi:hypothetical protein
VDDTEDTEIEMESVAPGVDGPSEPTVAPDEAAESPPSRKRGGRFLRGVVLGGLVGAASAFILGKQPSGEPSEGQDGPQDAPGGSPGGLLASLRSRWQEAASEAKVAAREAEQKKRARFLELTDLDDRH